MDEHRVAEGVEAVGAADGDPIGAEDARAAGEGRSQRQQGRARKMEIGDERVNDLESIAGFYEQTNPAAVSRVHPKTLKRANRGGSNSDNTLRLPDSARRRGRYFPPLRVDRVLFELFSFDGLKGAESDMERDERDPDTLPFDLPNQPWREMESCCRRGDRAGPARIHGLVFLE